MTFEEWWEHGDGKNSGPLKGDAREVWNAATAAAIERCAEVAESMRPAGGRMFSEAQSACFDALTDASKAIRALQEPQG